ncbi:MAG: HEAT repeat domain-containing protein [Planctomycetota bacterium]
MAKKTIKLNYRSVERFSSDYAQIKKGKLFLRSKTPLPAGTRFCLEFNLSGIDRAFMADGRVALSIDKQAADRFKKPQGMLVVILGGVEDNLKNLDSILCKNEEYRKILGLPHKIAVSQDSPAKRTDKHRFPPADKKAQEDPIPPIAIDAKTLDNNGTAADPARASEAKKIHVEIIGEEVKRESKKIKAAEPAEETLSSEDSELEDAESSKKTDDTALSLDWIKEALAQEKVGKEKEVAEEPETTAPPITEKKSLSAKEREKVKPAGDFLMDLTKAMLRSGYYASDHPGSKNAKRGLYKALQNSLVDSEEIMISLQEAGGKTDILITGILEEPVNVRILVGAGMSELFVPKLREYFKRKGLISFAIKKYMPLENFEKFVDIMGDPKSDQGENVHVGELLSNTLAEHGITEISTVFMDDMIAIEQNIPWRVEMAIQRLAKDLKVLPIFKGKSDEAIANLKLQIIQDIIRPLRRPEFLKDLVINCYIIATHVENMQTREIEQAIIDAFPEQFLLPTSKSILKELDQLKEAWKEHPLNEVLKRRITNVKRILKWVARRLALADAPGARSFFEQLYHNEILAFEELPPDVQYVINTMKMADDVRAHVKHHTHRILKAESVDDAVVILKFFKRAAPLLIENQDWSVLLVITKAVDKAAKEAPLTSEKTGLASDPADFVFEDLGDELVSAYLNTEESQRRTIDEITERSGSLGVEILSKVLSQSDDRGAHKAATDALIKKGDLARHWVLQVLDDTDQVWYLQRNALRVLSYVGHGDNDIDRARKLLSHSHPRIRDEALNTAISLKAGDAEQLIIAALSDEDDKVRWRATTSLSDLTSLSEASLLKLLDMIKAEPPEEKEAATKHAHKVGQLIRAIGARTDLPHLDQVEVTILEIARRIAKQEKGLLKRLKKSTDSEQAGILAAAISVLGNIGGSKSEAFLLGLVDSKSPQSETAQEAIDRIWARSGE